MPIAALGTIAYGDPLADAVAAAPLLVKATLVTVSPLTRPAGVNSVPANVTVCPYVFVRLFAVTVSTAGFTVICAVAAAVV